VTVLLAAGILTLPAALGQELSFAGMQSRLTTTGLAQPAGLTIDAHGNRYIIDTTLTGVIEVNAAGVQTTINSTLNAPAAIAVDSAGNLYVADTGHARVLKIPAGGGAQTVVGSGFTHPTGVAVDSLGNVYVADPGATPHPTAWKVAAAGGAPTAVAAAYLSSPVAVAVDAADNVYILDNGQGAAIKVTATGSPSYFKRQLGVALSGIAVDPAGYNVVIASAGQDIVNKYAINGDIQQVGVGLIGPAGVATDSSGNVYVVDNAIPGVEIIAPGAVDLGTANMCPSAGTQASPCEQTVVLNFIVGSSTGLSSVDARAVTQGIQNLDFTETSNTCTGSLNKPATCAITVLFKPQAPGIRLGAVDVVGIVAPSMGFQKGPHANFTVAQGAVLLSTVYLSAVGVAPLVGFDAAPIDTLGFVPHIAEPPAGQDRVHPNGGGGSQPTRQLQGITAVANGDLYVVDHLKCLVEKFTAATGASTVVAGSVCGTSAGDGGPATSAIFSNADQVAVDGRGNIYIPDFSGSAIRKVDAITGIITTVAGILNSYGYTAGGGVATSSTLSAPAVVAVDGAGDLYYSDRAEYMVRRVDANTGILTTVAGTHTIPGYSGDGGPATSAVLSDSPAGLALDPAGNLFIADAGNNALRKVTASTGIITTVAGTGGPTGGGYSGDGGQATAAQLNGPSAVSLDAAGSLYIADGNNDVVRKVNASTDIITTVAGVYSTNQPTQNSGDGGPATQATLVNLEGLALDGAGNFYITDGTHNVIRKVTVTEGVVTFGTFGVGNSSPAQNVTVTNNGNATLLPDALQPSANFNLSGAGTTCSTSGTYAAGASCVLGIEFLPTAPGALRGSVTLTDNAANDPTSTQSISVIGTGVALPVTATTLTSSNLTPVAGSSVTFTAAIAPPPTGIPLGTVNFYSGSTLLGTGSVNSSGIATLTVTSLNAGTDVITAVYSGNAAFASSTSAAITEQVSQGMHLAVGGIPPFVAVGGNLGTPTVSIENPNNTVLTSSSALVTMTITGPDGYSQVVSAAAVDGVATLDLSALPLPELGAYTVTTSSPGLPSLTTAVVTYRDFTLVFNTGTGVSPSQTVAPGAPAVYPLTLAPSNVLFSEPITMSATGLPPGATYTFSPDIVTPGSSAAPTTLTIQTAKTTALNRHQAPAGRLGGMVLALLLLPFVGGPRFMRRVRQWPLPAVVAGLILSGALLALSGCAVGGLFGHSPSTYTITVTGTSGPLSHSTTIQLTEE